MPLYEAFMREIMKPREYFTDGIPQGIVTWAFEVPGRFPSMNSLKERDLNR